MKIAFVTDKVQHFITEDDKLVLPYLSNSTVDCLAWDDETLTVEDWQSYDAVVIRSCWDYYTVPKSFNEWLRTMLTNKVNVFNAPEVILWNMDKSIYMHELLDYGLIEILPTVWIKNNFKNSLKKIMADKGWEKVVVKASISAGGHHNFITTLDRPEEYDEHMFQRMPEGANLLVQKFSDTLVKDGEQSLLFYGGEYSHAILKKPRKGGFLEQEHHGGTVEAVEPSLYAIERAKGIVDYIKYQFGQPVLYARVDGVDLKDEQDFVLMEMELIEPILYFEFHPEAPKRFAEALYKAIEFRKEPKATKVSSI